MTFGIIRENWQINVCEFGNREISGDTKRDDYSE